MAKRSILEMFEELEQFITACKSQTFSSNKVIIPRDQILTMIREIEMKIPNEVETSNRIIENRDLIIDEARRKSDEIIQAAQNEAQRRVNNNEITKMATEQAKALIMQADQKGHEIVAEAQQEANMIRLGALNYTNNVMKDLSDFTTQMIEEEAEKYQAALNLLKEQHDTIEANRSQISSQLNSGQIPTGDGKKSVSSNAKPHLSEVEKLHQETRSTSKDYTIKNVKEAETAKSTAQVKTAPATQSSTTTTPSAKPGISPAASSNANAVKKNTNPKGNGTGAGSSMDDAGVSPFSDEIDEIDEIFLDD